MRVDKVVHDVLYLGQADFFCEIVKVACSDGGIDFGYWVSVDPRVFHGSYCIWAAVILSIRYGERSTSNGIRTRVLAVRGLCPEPTRR